MGPEIVAFLLSNPWRTACIGLVVALLCAGVWVKIQDGRIALLKSKLANAETALTVYRNLSEEAKAKFEAAKAEQEKIRVRHEKLRNDMDKLLKDWPEGCEESADAALAWFKNRGKK